MVVNQRQKKNQLTKSTIIFLPHYVQFLSDFPFYFPAKDCFGEKPRGRSLLAGLFYGKDGGPFLPDHTSHFPLRNLQH